MEQQYVDRIADKRLDERPASAHVRSSNDQAALQQNRRAAAAIRTILAGASGGSASDGAIELACRLADRLRAHVEGYHVLLDPVAVFGTVGGGEGLALSGDVVVEMIDDADANAAKAKASFEQIAARHGLPLRKLAQVGAGRDCGPSVSWRQATGDAPNLIAERARFFDLVVLGRSSRVVDEPSSHTIEAVLARSGRPLLLAPAQTPAEIGRFIAVAWNGSPQAVRALAVSLPLLVAAESVLLITVGDGDNSDIPALLDYVAWHGIAAKHHRISDTSNESTGILLLKATDDAGADMLVMGGYGHRPWREALFGGVTRDIIGTSLLPLLLMH